MVELDLRTYAYPPQGAGRASVVRSYAPVVSVRRLKILRITWCVWADGGNVPDQIQLFGLFRVDVRALAGYTMQYLTTTKRGVDPRGCRYFAVVVATDSGGWGVAHSRGIF